MNRIFLSFSFREADRALASQVERLLESHDVTRVTGKHLGGEALTPAVQERIDQCDGLVALLTRRDQLASGKWTTHDWVRDELNYARDHGKRTIALIEEDVQTGGAFGENEWISLNRDAPLEAFLSLSETVGLWKRESGRRLTLQILPQQLAEVTATAPVEPVCQYRYYNANGQPSAWFEAKQIPQQGGLFVFLHGIQDDYYVQLKIQYGAETWVSRAVSAQSMPIELKPVQQAGGAS
jgi:hypothetical protein